MPKNVKPETMTAWEKGKGSAEQCFRDVERYFKSGNALNWIPQELSSAIHWAMEGWLIQKGIKPDMGNGWHSMRIQFFESSGESLASEAGYLLTASTVLEDELFEIDLDKWVIKARDLLSREKEFIQSMQHELIISSDNENA